MSQVSQFHIYFVLPKEDKNAQCEKNTYDAFGLVTKYNGKPQWLLPSACEKFAPKSNDLFVFEEFEGPAFDNLRKKGSNIISSRCFLRCYATGSSLPPGTSPIYSEGMRGLIVCLTGFAKHEDERQKLQERIEFMGGIYHATLRTVVTHVVARNTLSKKAIEAVKAKKYVMTVAWVDAVWERSKASNICGSDSEFDCYIAPLFYNIRMTTSGITKRKKDELKQMITQNGGEFTGNLEMHSTDILIIDAPEGDKFKAARDWKLPCVRSNWVRQCVQLKRILPPTDYALVELHKASTPKKEIVNFTANFSMVSNIESDERRITHLEETADITSTPVPVTDVLEKLSAVAGTSGQFLDGCNIYLHGFAKPIADKLRRILNAAGATRFDEMGRSVTHIVSMGPSVLRDTDAHIVSMQWLLDSANMKQPAPIYSSLEPMEKTGPPSPLSKQGALLLSRPESVPPVEEPEPPPQNDLVDMYNLSQPGVPLKLNTPRNHSQQSQSQTSNSSQFTQTNVSLFEGLKFFISTDLTDEESHCIKNLIAERKGTVLGRKFCGVLDFAIVPVAGASLTQITAKEVVNLFFIKECVVENRLVDVRYYHQPISWAHGTTPLENCVISLSKYLGAERDFLEVVIETLGAKVQDILAKKNKNDILKTTHLICAEPSGAKYAGALRWGLPVVHHKWLLKCAELGKKMPENEYSISESNVFHDVTSECNVRPEMKPVVTKESSMRTSQSLASSPAPPVVELNVTKENNLPVNQSLASSPAPPVEANVTKENSLRASQSLASSPAPPVLELNPKGTPCNKPLKRLIDNVTPTFGSPSTPTSPYGRCFGTDNPSPATRKMLYKWAHRGASFPIEPIERPSQVARNEGTPISELISKQLGLMMRKPEDRPPDDSPVAPPAKKINLGQYVNRIHKMHEIEADYSKNKLSSQSSSVCESNKVVMVSESQPHTEIGWEDPLERDSAPRIEVNKPKKFMFSSLANNQESAAILIEKSKGEVSKLSHFDNTATHLIASQGMTRTEKLMGSIAAGLWILHPSYLDQLSKVNDVFAVQEEDFEWGNPQANMPLNSLSNIVRECVISAYYWRCDIQIHKKQPPFSGIHALLRTSAAKADIFKRLIEAGGGVIVRESQVDECREKMLCICEPVPAEEEQKNFKEKGICCVSPLVVSDFILRKPTAVQANLVPGFEDVWKG